MSKYESVSRICVQENFYKYEISENIVFSDPAPDLKLSLHHLKIILDPENPSQQKLQNLYLMKNDYYN